MAVHECSCSKGYNGPLCQNRVIILSRFFTSHLPESENMGLILDGRPPSSRSKLCPGPCRSYSSRYRASGLLSVGFRDEGKTRLARTLQSK